MATLGDIVTNLVANTSRFTGPINAARGTLSQFASVANSVAGRAAQSVAGIGGGIVKSVGAGTGALAKFGLAAQGVSAIISTLQGAALPVSLAADAEKMQVSFTTLLGSADKAKKVLADLEQFAAATPFQQSELNESARKLLAFGVEAQHLIPTLTALGDVSAGIDQPIAELAELFGKAKVQGRLMAEDINQLTGRGIPIIGELAKQFGVAESQVRKLVESGQVNFGHLQKAFANMTGEGGKFSGLMAAQSQTVSGLWSTLKDNLLIALKQIGMGFIETFNVKGTLEGLIGFASTIGSQWAPMITGAFTTVRDVIGGVVSWVSSTWSSWVAGSQEEIGVWIVSLSQAWSRFSGFVQEVFTGIGSFISQTAGSFWSTWSGTFKQIGEALAFTLRNWDTLFLIAVENVRLFASNGWQYILTFFDNFGRWLAWLPDNWWDVLKTLASLLSRAFINMAKNVSNFFKSLFDFASGKGFKFESVSLTEGFENSIKELPKLTEAAVQNTTPELERLYNQLGQQETDFQKQLAERTAAANQPPKITGPDVVPQKTLTLADIAAKNNTPVETKKEKNKQELKSIDARSAEAFAAIQAAMRAPGQKSPQEQIAKNTATAAKALADIKTGQENTNRKLDKLGSVPVAPSLSGGRRS